MKSISNGFVRSSCVCGTPSIWKKLIKWFHANIAHPKRKSRTMKGDLRCDLQNVQISRFGCRQKSSPVGGDFRRQPKRETCIETYH